MRINSIYYIKIQKYIILSFFKKQLWNNIILNLFKLIFATHNLSGLGLITTSYMTRAMPRVNGFCIKNI